MKLTVFTPTYNRAYIIENLYRSLQRQTCHDFEWLVIDDGSTDNTYELFEKWQKENNFFQIRYQKCKNEGKQQQINRALDLAQGILFFTVDSDDVLVPHALEFVIKWEESIQDKERFCALAGSHGDMQGNPTNPTFSEEYVDASFFDRNPEAEKFIGFDRPWVFYTDIHRRYKYPQYHGERFITEAVAWNRMAADGYRVRCFNDAIYLWEHQSDGYTYAIQDILRKNPYGYGLWKKELLEFEKAGLIKRIKTYYCFYEDLRLMYTWKDISAFIEAPRWMMIIAILYYYLRWRWLCE